MEEEKPKNIPKTRYILKSKTFWFFVVLVSFYYIFIGSEKVLKAQNVVEGIGLFMGSFLLVFGVFLIYYVIKPPPFK